MATGIRDKVAILGMGCTRFGERWESSGEDLIIEAFQEALKDAGIEKKEIQAAWFGTHIDEVNVGKSGVPLATTLKLPFIPVTRTENYCATGTEAFRGACYAVAAGVYDFCLALGVEKLKDTGYGGLPATTAFGQMQALVGPNATAPGLFAQLATSYFAKYEVDPKAGEKSHGPHLRQKPCQRRPESQGPSAPGRFRRADHQCPHDCLSAWPLRLLRRERRGGGGHRDHARDRQVAEEEEPVLVKALAISVSSGEESMFNNWDGAHLETTYRAGQMAFQEAGIKNPREEISMMEVHDCFSITELTVYEDLQISPRGRAIEDITERLLRPPRESSLPAGRRAQVLRPSHRSLRDCGCFMKCTTSFWKDGRKREG